MSDVVQMEQKKKASLSQIMAARFDLEPAVFIETIKATCFPKGTVTNEMLIAFLSVANEYELNPFTREIYAFPNKNGGIQPIVSIDGWLKLINRHPQFDGMEFVDHLTGEDAQLYAVTCKIYRKDRSRPTEVTEYMDECKRPTDPWKGMPKRMLRHKAAIQAGRYAFGFAGIQDEDEARDVIAREVGPAIATATATETKKEELKTKIGAKRAAKAQETPKPEEPAPIEPTAPIEEPSQPELPVEEPQESDVAKAIKALKAAGRITELREPNMKILKDDRDILMAEIKKIADNLPKDMVARFEDDARAFLMSLGCPKSWDLRYDLLVEFYNWLDQQTVEALV